MGAEDHLRLMPSGRIVLAHEESFTLGAVLIEPATRTASRGDLKELLEPRVMQVLVALHKAGGHVLSRDDLIAQCWEGRVVGDDSINRVMARLRRLSTGLAERSFDVETIPRVGHRLVGSNAAARPGVNRRMAIAGAVGAAAVATMAGIGLWRREAPSTEARTLYERALTIRHNGATGNRQALAHLQEAVRLSPDYGEAWGALALAYRSAINNETSERVRGFEQRLREAVRNAERHDPGNANAALAMLPSKSPFGRWGAYEPLYRSAIARNPDHAGAYSLLGSLLMDVGRWSSAVQSLQAARRRDPSSPLQRYKLTIALWSAGQVNDAEREIDEAMRLWPQHGAIWQTKVKLLALTGRADRAFALASDPAARPLNTVDAPNSAGRLQYLRALTTSSAADIDRAIAMCIEQARRVEAERVNVALQAVSLGRAELGLDLLEGVYLRHGPWAIASRQADYLVAHPLFQPHARPLWQTSRFQGILSAIGLEDYWRSTRTRPDYRA